MASETEFTATFVDYINISSTTSTTELPADFVTMLCDQEIQCHSEAGEIVPNTLDELVSYLDIEGARVESELLSDDRTIVDEQFNGYTTFGTEDEWPV